MGETLVVVTVMAAAAVMILASVRALMQARRTASDVRTYVEDSRTTLEEWESLQDLERRALAALSGRGTSSSATRDGGVDSLVLRWLFNSWIARSGSSTMMRRVAEDLPHVLVDEELREGIIHDPIVRDWVRDWLADELVREGTPPLEVDWVNMAFLRQFDPRCSSPRVKDRVPAGRLMAPC